MPRDRIHRLGQIDVEPGDAAGVVRGQHHLHGLVDIAPFRVVIALFSHQRDAALEPMARRTFANSRGDSIVVTTKNNTLDVGFERDTAK